MEGRENRIVWFFFVAFIAIIIISLLFGCKAKTVNIHHTNIATATLPAISAFDATSEYKRF
jgi:hypothetical protein